jgi:16S rRNA (guanine(527)-N(7))-methyltransferase RsmG
MTGQNELHRERNTASDDTVISFDADSLLAKYDPHDSLEAYFRMLLLENRRINLVSRETSHESLRTLAAESLLPLEIVGRSFESYLDIGSGGGLPAIPILMCVEGIAKAYLVERTMKKAGALRRILAQLELKAEILPVSFEDARLEESFDLITLRLVRPTKSLLGRIRAQLKPGGFFVHYSEPASLAVDLFVVKTYSYCSAEQPMPKHFSVFAAK